MERDSLMENVIGKLIGSGGTATVYEWGSNEIIKVFKPSTPIETIKNEEYIGKILNGLPLNIPKYKKTLEIGDKPAIIYERINGRQLAEILIDATDRSEIAANFAKMHYEIHQHHTNELPLQHKMLNWRISKMENYLGTNNKKIQDLLDSLPIENNLCHGDFHLLNIHVDCDKYIALDWEGSCTGNPILDVAWSYLTLISPLIEAVYGQPAAQIVTEFTNEYLNYYCLYANTDKDLILKYLPIVAVRRLYDNITCEADASKYENDWLKTIIFSI